MRASNRATLILGVTQTIGYASSIYLPAALAAPMARAVGVAPWVVFLALSAALLLQAVCGPAIGRLTDRRGGRAPLSAASLLFAAGLTGLGLAHDPIQLFLAWLVVGCAMAAGLYDVAFAALVGWFGVQARGPITGVTLIAGFASTIGWPLTSWLESQADWRWACFAWAGANLLVALPLHLSLPRRPAARSAPEAVERHPAGRQDLRTMALMAAAFALLAGIGSALSAALPRTLTALSATPEAAIAASALVGPAQVAARLSELLFVRRLHPLQSGRIAVGLIGGGVGLLLVFGAGLASLSAALYGAGIGLFTIVRGALPLALFGERDYGHRLGVLSVPGRLLQAAAPFLFVLGLERSPRLALAALGVGAAAALGALLLLRRPAAEAGSP